MPRYLAFLRAINVGGHVVKMDALRRLFEGLGFAHVETFIASGNVIFDAPARSVTKLEPNIEAHLERALGYPVETFIRTPVELKSIAQRQPFGRLDPDEVVYVTFMRSAPVKVAEAAVMALASDAHAFHIEARELYWLRRRKLDDGKFSGANLERALQAPITVRNLTTVEKLAARYA